MPNRVEVVCTNGSLSVVGHASTSSFRNGLEN